jgi:hypothetical protein
MNPTCPQNRKVLVDASSAILLFKAGLFEFLVETYAVQMATSVYTEVTCEGYAGAESFILYRNRLKIRVISLNSFPGDVQGVTTDLPSHLGAGERDTIMLFDKGAGAFIIIDDGRGAAWCRDHRIPYINALLFPLILQSVDILSKETCRVFMSRIIGIGRYSASIIAFARSCEPHHLEFFFP